MRDKTEVKAIDNQEFEDNNVQEIVELRTKIDILAGEISRLTQICDDLIHHVDVYNDHIRKLHMGV